MLLYNFRLAREAGLEYVEIQNLTEFYDDNRLLNSSTQIFFDSQFYSVVSYIITAGFLPFFREFAVFSFHALL